MAKRFLGFILAVCVMAPACAGDELEYKMDIGGSLGLCYYLGDANSTPLRGSSVMAAINLRRNFNPRMALKTSLSFGRFSGTTEGYYFPEGPGSTAQRTDVQFKGNVIDLGTQFELNFWGYGMGPGYKKLSRITPYMLLGFGLTFGITPDDTCFGVNFPVGGGVKYKVKPRLNLAFEWSVHFSTTDKLDGLSDPYYIKSSGIKNKDAYSFFMLSLSYDISPKLRKCNN
ncbi:MAG: DUF6089 family protein [Bacteroidaceae bacterium]|nr:DUF6089 family protein [Bacteroidaceae bacterium]